MSDSADRAAPSHDIPENQNFEEECVICLEELKQDDQWGRCEPCHHAFHKKCWWDWENAHNERVASSRRQGNNLNDQGPKCCLCNAVVNQFVDGEGEPAHNPEPFVAQDEEENRGFFDWFLHRGQRGADAENGAPSGPDDVTGAMDFLERMAEQGGSVMGMDASVLLDQIRYGGGFGFPRMDFGAPSGADDEHSNRSNNADRSNNNNGFNFGRMFQEWGGVGPFGAPRRNTAAHASEGPFNQIRPGTPIVIQDLVNNPHLNGQRGTVHQFNEQTERYLIKLDSNNVTIALKPENILQILTIKILGLVSQPLFNGREGTIVSYNKERNRYVVRVSLPNEMKEISIKACNIRIPDLTRVRLEGLESQPQWNGRYGTIMKWEDGKYLIKLSNMYSVRVKVENARL